MKSHTNLCFNKEGNECLEAQNWEQLENQAFYRARFLH